MTDQQPHTPPDCEHHWVHYGQPSHSPIRWIVKCSQCNQFNIPDLQEQVDEVIAAAEQRGAARGWDEGHDAGVKENFVGVPGINPYRADQEGDDE